MGVLLDDRELNESPQLLSITEGSSLCPGSGFDGNDQCGDELDPNQELCPSCKRIEDRHFQEQLWRADGHEVDVFYEHLTDRD